MKSKSLLTRTLAIASILAVLAFSACGDGGDGGGGGQTYAIGDTGPGGGKVFYYSAAGFTVAGLGTCHYLEAAPSQVTSIDWCTCRSYGSGYCNVTGTGTAIGTGKANTAAILALPAHSGVTTLNCAAKAAVAYTGGGKSDWFLPSKDELNEMYKERSHFRISSGTFWSSSQCGNNEEAWYQSLTDGNQYEYTKVDSNIVRAIRAF